MLRSSERSLPRLQSTRTTAKTNNTYTPRLCPMLLNNLTRDRDELSCINRVTEINKRIPILRIGTSLLR